MKLLIDGYGKSIHKKDNQLLVKEKDTEIYRINIRKVSDITIVGKGYITFDELNLISRNNLKLMAINYFGQIEYVLDSPYGENIGLRKKQYYASDDEKGVVLAKEMIVSKMKNQKSTLRTLNKNRKIPEIKQNERKIDRSIKELNKLDPHSENVKNRIMGIEGSCSNVYWSGISRMLPHGINFENRNQKPKNDVVNSALNYGYGILASQITRAIMIQGLDPYCGFLHADRNKRTSLTYDIIEEFRQQIVDKTIFKLINNNQMSEKDIDKRNNALNLETRKLLSSNILDKLHSEINYGGNISSYLELIENQVNGIVEYIINDEKYRGFYLRW